MTDFYAPLEDWDFQTLQRYMAWKVIEGITTGQKIESVVWEFPGLVLNWKQSQDQKK